MWHEERLLIDGDLVAAQGSRTFETINPATAEPLGTASDATLGDTERAIAGARRAFDSTTWSRDVAFRTHCLRQLHEAIVEHREDLRQLIVAEVGAPLMLTKGPQLEAPMEIVSWHADLLEKYDFREELGVREVMGRKSNRWVEKEAVGVVAAIVPYNYPFQITMAKLIPALAAGCTVIVKGPPQTPWVNASIGALLAETDIPSGVVSVLNSSEAAVGEALVTDPRVDMVSFTGSTAVGRRIQAVAADTVKKVFLELGGKSAFIVLDDADLEMAAMVAGFTACSHAGQGCAITTRLLVPEATYGKAAELVGAVMGGVPVGDPADETNLMGPLISARQRDIVEEHVQRAIAEGGRIVTGGKRPDLPGYFFEPTLVADVDNSASIAQNEVFGPVLTLIPYKDDDDAVRIANDSIFGLSGGVFGTDLERATDVGRRIRSGTISINGGVYYGPDAPFGGYKQSGVGREMGVAGFEEYLELKTLATPAG
jgi:aldehyde dehydrogenase (NAD+)